MLKKILGIVFLVSGFWGLVSSASAQTESITFTTYYPSPYGVYKNLRIYPSTGTGLGGACSNEGEMYYDQTDHNLYICSGTPTLTWTAVGGAAGSSWWTQAGNNLYPNEGDWNVGIGTTNPASRLQISGDIVNNFPRPLYVQGSSGGVHTAAFVNPQNYGVAIGGIDGLQYGTIQASQFVNGSGPAMADLILNELGGNVGIGMNNPGAKLDVQNPSGNALTLAGQFQNLNNAASQNGLSINIARSGTDAYALKVQSAATSRLYVRGDGNVGIGTTAPSSKLQVSGGVQIGTDGAACSAAKAGTLRYNAGKVEYCNGAQWKDLATPTTTFAVCADADHSTWCSAYSVNECSCSGGTLISKVQSTCTATSDSDDTCSAWTSTCQGGLAYGTCCVCRP
jgi:hypothetical protein